MNRKRLWSLTLVLVAFALVAMKVAAAQPHFTLLHSLFDHRTNASPLARQGLSVGVDGSIVVVGTPIDTTLGPDSGVVNIYNASTGALLHTLTNPSPLASGYFGSTVGVSGTRVVVGTPLDDIGATNAGIAYVFDIASLSPTIPIFTLTNPTPIEGDEFGISVAISGARAVVGAHGDDTGAANAGSAYVYDLAGVAPTVPVLTLTNPGPAANDFFGRAVAISATRVLVGAYQDDGTRVNSGSAYVYELTSPMPTTPTVNIPNPFTDRANYFGYAVGISSTHVVVGSPYDRTGAAATGIAHVFDLASLSPSVPILTLTNPSPSIEDLFGWSVTIFGNCVVVGAFGDDTGANSAGSAYVYDLASAGAAVPVAVLNNPSPGVNDLFGFSVAISETTVVAGAPLDFTGSAVTGVAFVFRLLPVLSIAPAAPGLATLSWTPTSSPVSVLQYTDSLAPTNWVNAPSGAMNPVTTSTTNTARFYRLIQQQ